MRPGVPVFVVAFAAVVSLNACASGNGAATEAGSSPAASSATPTTLATAGVNTTTTAVAPSTTVLTGLHRVTDRDGRVSIEVPGNWVDVSEPGTNGGFEFYARASPDPDPLYSHPVIQVGLVFYHPELLPAPPIDVPLISQSFSSCEESAHEPTEYSLPGGFTGFAWTGERCEVRCFREDNEFGCQGVSAYYLLRHESGEYSLLFRLEGDDVSDLAVLDHALESVQINTDGFEFPEF